MLASAIVSLAVVNLAFRRHRQNQIMVAMPAVDGGTELELESMSSDESESEAGLVEPENDAED